MANNATLPLNGIIIANGGTDWNHAPNVPPVEMMLHFGLVSMDFTKEWQAL